MTLRRKYIRVRSYGFPARAWSAPRITALVLVVLILAIGLSLFSLRAYAAFVPAPNSQGPHLQLLSATYTAQFSDLSPGVARQWQIKATTGEPTATLTAQFAASGSLVTQPIDGLHMQVQSCDAEWADVSTLPACPDTRQNVFGPAAASTILIGTETDLGGISGAKGKYLLVTVFLPDTAYARSDRSLQGLSGIVGVGLTASSDAASITGGTDTPHSLPVKKLAITGSDAVPLLLLAVGAIGLGIIVSGARRIRFSTADRATS